MYSSLSSHNPTPHQPHHPTRFTTQDDSLLKGGIEKHSSLQTIAEQIKFSCKFDLHDIADRWRTLLYEPDVAAESASKAEAEAYKAKRVPWSEEEEDFLRSETRKDLDFKRILGGAMRRKRLFIDVDTESVVFNQLIGCHWVSLVPGSMCGFLKVMFCFVIADTCLSLRDLFALRKVHIIIAGVSLVDVLHCFVFCQQPVNTALHSTRPVTHFRTHTHTLSLSHTQTHTYHPLTQRGAMSSTHIAPQKAWRSTTTE